VSDLLDGLLRIKDEKDTKILPENLKKGITAFGITGTLEDGSGDTKTFETEEEMYADENPIPEGKALIYRRTTTNISAKTHFTKIYFPETVVLPRAVTESVTQSITIASNSSEGGAIINISADGMDVDFNLNMSYAAMSYSSVDGITFVRSRTLVYNMDTYGDYWEFEDDVLYIKQGTNYSEGYYMYYTSMDETNTDIIQPWLRQNGFGYYGLYKCSGSYDGTRLKTVKNFNYKIINESASSVIDKYNVTYDTNYNQLYAPIQTAMTLLKDNLGVTSYGLIEIVDDTHYIVYDYKYDSNSYYSDCSIINFIENTGDDNFYIGASGNVNICVHSIDISNSTVTDITSQQDIQSVTIGSSTVQYINKPVSQTHYFTRCYWSYNESGGRTIFAGIFAKDSTSYWSNFDIQLGYGKVYSYTSAETQFTLNNKNQLLPDVCALGTDGEYVGDGTIFQNVTYEQYMNYNNIDLREGIIYAASANDINIVDTPCETTDKSLQYIQCKKIEQKFSNYYLISKSDLFHIWYKPMSYTFKVCNTSDEELYEYKSSYNFTQGVNKQIIIDNIQYMFINKSLYKITSTEMSEIYTSSISDAVTILTNTGMYIASKSSSSSTTVDIVKVSYEGKTTTLSTWARSSGTSYYDDGTMILENGYLYIVLNTGNSNYGYLCIIQLSDDTVTFSEAYSKQGWLMHDIHTNQLLFGQYANKVVDVYAIATDGTLTQYGTINGSLYNKNFSSGYFVPELNSIVGLGEYNGIASYCKSSSTSIDYFAIGYLISGDLDQTYYYQTSLDVICENSIVKANMMYYNDKLNLNYECTFTIDISHSFSETGNSILFGINSSECFFNRYRKVNILPTAVNTQYENTITPTEYDIALETTSDILGKGGTE
jgi:hypothetical protein